MLYTGNMKPDTTRSPHKQLFLLGHFAGILLFGNKCACAASGRSSVNESAHSYTFWPNKRQTIRWTVGWAMLNFYGRLYSPRALVRLVKFACWVLRHAYRVIYDEWRSARVRISSYKRNGTVSIKAYLTCCVAQQKLYLDVLSLKIINIVLYILIKVQFAMSFSNIMFNNNETYFIDTTVRYITHKNLAIRRMISHLFFH